MAKTDFYAAAGKNFIDSEILQWKEKAALIEQEIVFAHRVFDSQINQVQIDSIISKLLTAFEKIRIKNNEFQQQIAAFMVKAEGIRECDDLQCEDYFMDGYRTFQLVIEQHFTDYRKTKTAFLKLAAKNDFFQNKTIRINT